MKRLGWAIALLLLIVGSASAQRAGYSPPDPFILNDSLAQSQGVLPYRTTNGLTQRTQAIVATTLAVIVAGQSNCTSINPTLYTPSSSSVIEQMNVYDGGSYEINGPMLGTQLTAGQPGNVAARLAQNAITGGFAKVVVVNVCIAGSLAADWATGSLKDRIPVAVKRLISRGYVPGTTNLVTAIWWLQGETDTVVTGAAYKASMATILANAQAAGFNCTACWIFVNKQTWLAGSVNATIQTAQTDLWGTSKFKQGADADSLNATNRQADNTHFNDTGAPALATLGWSAFHAAGAPFP